MLEESVTPLQILLFGGGIAVLMVARYMLANAGIWPSRIGNPNKRSDGSRWSEGGSRLGSKRSARQGGIWSLEFDGDGGDGGGD